MAAAIPVHSKSKGKVNDEVVPNPSEAQPSGLSDVPSIESGGPVQASEVQVSGPLGVKLDSHEAWRFDY